MAFAKEYTTLNGTYTLSAPISTRRVSASDLDLPFLAPPYSSLIQDVFTDIHIHKYKDLLRQNALHPVKLQAGQANFPNGELGRPATPDPVLIPEMIGGRVLTTNV